MVKAEVFIRNEYQLRHRLDYAIFQAPRSTVTGGQSVATPNRMLEVVHLIQCARKHGGHSLSASRERNAYTATEYNTKLRYTCLWM